MNEKEIEIRWTANGVLVMPRIQRDYCGIIEWDKCFVFNEQTDLQRHLRKWWKEHEPT